MDLLPKDKDENDFIVF